MQRNNDVKKNNNSDDQNSLAHSLQHSSASDTSYSEDKIPTQEIIEECENIRLKDFIYDKENDLYHFTTFQDNVDPLTQGRMIHIEKMITDPDFITYYNDSFIYDKKKEQLFYIEKGSVTQINIENKEIFKQSLANLMVTKRYEYSSRLLNFNEINELITLSGGKVPNFPQEDLSHPENKISSSTLEVEDNKKYKNVCKVKFLGEVSENEILNNNKCDIKFIDSVKSSEQQSKILFKIKFFGSSFTIRQTEVPVENKKQSSKCTVS